MDFTRFFGEKLRTPKGNLVSTTQVTGNQQAIGIYFSAHWCPPCRGFTPKLSETYTRMKAAGTKFEIVFASSDRDQAEFEQYHGEMPWHAIPFENRAAKETLAKLFGVKGIPMLVIVDSDGTIITTDGRNAVENDRSGKNFPWSTDTAIPDVNPGKSSNFHSKIVKLSIVLAVAAVLLALAYQNTLEGVNNGAISPRKGIQLQIVTVSTPVSCPRKSKVGDTISVHYTGRIAESGREFESSANKDPTTFTLGKNRVIKGWEQGLLEMCQGEKRLVTVPSHLAYGDRGDKDKGIPGGAILSYDLELVSFS